MTRLFTLISFLALAPLASAAQPDESWPVGSYKIQTSYEPSGDRYLAIMKDGQELYGRRVGQFWFLNASRGRLATSSHDPVLSDVTGDGVPDLVIEEFPRNAHCCWSYTILSMGKTVKEVATADGFPSPMTLEDVNGDGVFELTGDDWTFYSWYASPRIVLRNDKGHFRLASELMRRPAPNPEQLAAKAAEFRKATVYAGSPVAPEVSRYMLELIYSGNGESAWSFLDLAWPKQQSGKAEFIQKFKEDLAKSRFWPEVRDMSKTPPTSTDH